MTSDELKQYLQEKGYFTQIVDSAHVEDLKTESESAYQDNQIDRTLYEQYLSRFEYESTTQTLTPRSIVIIAVRSPQFTITFSRHQNTVSALIPPTYVYWKQTRQRITQTVNAFLSPHGYRGNLIRLPEKLLATQSGLAVYGKNNISYVNGLGSFHRLVALVSDLPCKAGHWVRPQLADRCSTCNACVVTCPTNAIRTDRFVISAERCLTFHNEQPSHIPFPDWIDPLWHNCLIGCMKCQSCCPMNRQHLDWIETGPSFSEEETTLLLTTTQVSQLPKALTQKLEQYDLTDYLDVLPRNLQALLAAKRSQ